MRPCLTVTALERADDHATAMALVRKVVSSHPHNVEALIELGRLLLAKGAYYEVRATACVRRV